MFSLKNLKVVKLLSSVTFKRNLTVSDHIYRKLIEHKVDSVHIYSGGAIMPLIDKLFENEKIKYYVHAHEQYCGHAATAYARVTGKTGVVFVTSGPGLTNSITPMLDAQNDSVPLLVISGQVGLKHMGSNAFQEAPSTQITQPITKWSHLINDSKTIDNVMDKAFRVSQHNKKGVVHLDLPKNIATEEVTENKKLEVIHYEREIKKNDNKIQSSFSVESIFEKIITSKRPVLYIGQGANDCTEELNKLINKLNIPFTTTIHALGVVDEKNKNSLKFVGMHGSVAANTAIQKSDCIIALGSRFDDRTTGNIKGYAPEAIKNKGIIHVNIEPSEINKVIKADFLFNGSCKTFLNQLIELEKFKSSAYNIFVNWNAYLENLKKENKFEYSNDSKLRMPFVIECLDTQLRNIDFVITTGVGNHQMHTAQYITWKKPKTFISSGSLGTMGFGLPAAIGAKIGNPNALVIDIDGDSSFLMTATDLKTIKEYNLDVKIIILNNESQGMVMAWENLFFEKRVTATKNNNNPDFGKLSEAFGFTYFYCSSKEKVKETLVQFLKHEGTAICEFRVEYELCLPLVPPSNNLDDMVTYPCNLDSLGGTAPS